MKKVLIGTAVVVMAGFLAIQTINAEPGRSLGPGERGFRTSDCDCPALGRRHADLTEEQVAQRKEYRDKVRELKSEFHRDVIDGDRIAALRDELRNMRTEMGLPERKGKGNRDTVRGKRIPGSGDSR